MVMMKSAYDRYAIEHVIATLATELVDKAQSDRQKAWTKISKGVMGDITAFAILP